MSVNESSLAVEDLCHIKWGLLLLPDLKWMEKSVVYIEAFPSCFISTSAGHSVDGGQGLY